MAAPRSGVAPRVVLAMVTALAACSPAKADEDPIQPVPPPPAVRSCTDAVTSCGVSVGAMDCCETPWIRGDTFQMGFSPGEVKYPEDLSMEDLDHAVTISGFFLDRFEISVARYAAYAREYAGPPAPGSGRHPRLPDSGWQSAWDGYLPASQEALFAQLRWEGGQPPLEQHPDDPMGSLTWYMAFSFCIWDGGRLPTEAEWEFAAAGGRENLPYPWGSNAAVLAAVRSPGATGVGQVPAARGRFGHDDLAGGVQEWALDWFGEHFYVEGGAECHDCANLVVQLGRVVRGAPDSTCCAGIDTEFRAAARAIAAPGIWRPTLGARCARDP